MAGSVLSRYIDASVLSRLAGRRIEPRGLAIGSLAGGHRSPLSGFAVEFAGHREYGWGDDPKHIDWRVFYTRDKYFIKQYQMETNFVCHLVLDTSASMLYGSGLRQKLQYASRLVATLAHAIVARSDKVSLTLFDDEIRAFVPASHSPGQTQRLIEQLDQVEPLRKTRLAECLVEANARIGRRELVFVFSDFFSDLDALQRSLERLRYLRHEVVLFQTLHPDELEFDFRSPVKFVGLESAEETLTDPAEMRGAYLAALKRFQGRFQEICDRRRVERVLLDTRRDLGQALVDYLNHRSRLNRGR